jgi:hypothetical protein
MVCMIMVQKYFVNSNYFSACSTYNCNKFTKLKLPFSFLSRE